KLARVKGGELSPRTFEDYKGACDELVSAFGKNRLAADLAPDDFATLRGRMAAKWGPHRLGKMLKCVRIVLKYAADNDLIATPPRSCAGFHTARGPCGAAPPGPGGAEFCPPRMRSAGCWPARARR